MFTKRQILAFCGCLAAMAASTLGNSQWPARYNNPSENGLDAGHAVAVDRHGNVYVTGKSYGGTTTQFDFLTISYDASGNVRTGWPKRYDGTGHGDDIPTSIHVDYDGNVYVGGTSYGGDPADPLDPGTGFDLCVIKYDSGGTPQWSSSSGIGYEVDNNGAIRTTSTQREGVEQEVTPGIAGIVYASMDVRNSFTPANRVIAITGIVTVNNDDWRTIVIEQTGTTAQFKANWPVDFGSSNEDLPRDVAIHSDNSVYVTGSKVFGASDTRFMVLKYGATASTIWTYDWKEGASNFGTAITVDKDGNAYATGAVENDGVSGGHYDYGTVRINKDPVSGSPDVPAGWPVTYDNGGYDVAAAIDLTYQIESGVLKPFVHVTGRSEASGPVYGIATGAYRGDNGNDVYAELRTSGSSAGDEGLAIVGAGDGNVYVVGRARATTYNYIILGYDKSGTARFSAQSYDNGLFDEGRALAMSGAGRFLVTGVSNGSNDYDYLTNLYTQSTTTDSPSSDWIAKGSLVTGSAGISGVSSDDGTYRKYLYGENINRGPQVQVEFYGTTQVADPTEITFTVVTLATETGINQTVEVYDYLTAQWELVDTRNATITNDLKLVLVMKDDADKYVDGGGNVKVRLSWEKAVTTMPRWEAWVDEVSWTVLGP